MSETRNTPATAAAQAALEALNQAYAYYDAAPVQKTTSDYTDMPLAA